MTVVLNDYNTKRIANKERLAIWIDKGALDHNVYTPFELCDEIVDRLGVLKEQKILVFYSLEMIHILQERGCNLKDIYLVGDTANYHKSRLGKSLGGFLTPQELERSNMKFDIVVGNPPFQKTFDGKRDAKKYNLWSEFLQASMLKSTRIALIIPDGWMSTGTAIFDKMKAFGIRYINIGDCSKHFKGVGTRFTYVVLEKGYNGPTEYEYNGEINSIQFDDETMITPKPEQWSILKKITSSSDKMGWRRGRGYHTSSNKDILVKKGEYRVFHTNAQEFRTNQPLGDLNEKKVIGTISGWFKPIYDTKGEIGVTQATAVLLTKNTGAYKKLLATKFYRYVFDHIAKQQGWINLTILKNLSAIPMDRDWDDKALYKHFRLTKKEINLIESSF